MQIVVHEVSYAVAVELLGLDELGRQQYRCPTLGCGQVAYLDENGRGHCPTDEAMREFWIDAFARLVPGSVERATEHAVLSLKP